MLTVILSILLILYILQALLKFGVHFFVGYQTRRQRIDAMYKGAGVAIYDDLVLLLAIVFIGLLLASGSMDHLSFWTGLVVGMTLVQVYFHRIDVPLAEDRAP